jgi:tetratricopeptide (TPR) repeat protein
VYFDAVPKPEKVEKLEDLAPVIELYHHTVRAGKLDEAKDLLEDRLIPNPLYFQFGAYQLCIELLRALFLDGEDKPPRLKNESAQAWTLNALANSYSLSGQSRRAVPSFQSAVVLAEKMGNKKNVAIGLGNVAYMAQIYIGALSEAECNLRRSIDLCREIDEAYYEGIGHAELGLMFIYAGLFDEAEKEFPKAIELFEKGNNIQYIGIVWSYRALRFLLMARESVDSNQSQIANLKPALSNVEASSIECAQRALELADEWTRTHYPVPHDYVRTHWLLGAAYRAHNKLTLAEENLSKALNLCRQINLVDTEADILLDLARLRYAQGDFKDAQEKASEALVITERSGYVLQGADVNLFLAELASLAGNSKSGIGLGDWGGKEMARKYAEEALRLATCDGPPYYYKVAYDEAERMLARLSP